jgi:hypothetical protein
MRGALTIVEVVESYCLRTFNDKRKYFMNYLAFAKEVWDEVFLHTLWAYKSVWVSVRKGSPHPFFELPKDIGFLIGIFYESCGQLVEVSRNPHASVVAKPTVKSCGCDAECNCGDLCSSVNYFSMSEKEIEIDGDTYTERTWLESCANGDLLEWKETPTKRFYDQTGDEYDIITTKSQRWICKVDVKPCGCLEDTPKNTELVTTLCGCTVPCETELLQTQTTTSKPQIAFSDCGKKVFIISGAKKDFFIKYQPKCASDNSLVPKYSLKAVRAGMDLAGKEFNPMIGEGEKDAALRRFRREKQDIVEFLNRLSFEDLAELERQPNKW